MITLRGLKVAFVLLVLCQAALSQGTVITVDAASAGTPISPLLYGIFFEEINHAGDGGLYAELVQNRSFEDSNVPVAWRLIEDGGGKSRIAIDTSQPLNARNKQSLFWEIESGASRVSIANAGYWGIAVQKGKRYRLSLYARCSANFRGALTVSLQSTSGTVYAVHTLRGIGTSWKMFSATLTARETDPKAQLVISTTSPGTLWLDMVSLMPVDTFKNRQNGLRTDLAQMLADLKPSFLRFPGGCFVEGNRMSNALRWKDTVGDIAQRPTRWCLWGYQTTQGLGLHEYLQMSEDLGAEPMLVVNCGMACQYRTNEVAPLDQLQEWIDDALFAIEYAIGDTRTPAGALRAKNGRPKPFKLRFVEVGNENWGPQYDERYARFYDAIKARFPQIEIIANSPVRNRPMDILSEHFYSSPEWFISQANRYDQYDRSGPKIFVGEYAVTQKCGTGNLRAAIAEAAFMTGMERNSDIVVMAAYAPLFVNVNDRTWNPDLIAFDSARSYGTPSYYVQKLFSVHRGTHVLPTQVVNPPGFSTESHGAIGLGTWRTQAEFRDVQVTRNGEVLFSHDFAQGSANWRVVRGNWQVQNDAYRQLDSGTDNRSVAGDIGWRDYTLSLRARKLGGDEGFLIMFRVRDDNNWYWWNIGGWGNTRHAVEKCVGGGKSIISESVPGSVETDRWYSIRIEVMGNRIRCYLDNKLIHDFEDRPLPGIFAVASRNRKTNEIILKAVNVTDSTQEVELLLQGVRSLASAATLVTLTSKSPDDENSLEHPTRVAPVQSILRGVSPRFRHVLPAHSLSVFILKERPK